MISHCIKLDEGPVAPIVMSKTFALLFHRLCGFLWGSSYLTELTRFVLFLLFSGVTTVLSITTIGFGGRSQLPKTDYATSLDWFIILCFSFVFAVMIEYAIINFIDKVTQDIKNILNKRKKTKEEQEEKATQSEESGDEIEKPKEDDKVVGKDEKVSKIPYEFRKAAVDSV